MSEETGVSRNAVLSIGQVVEQSSPWGQRVAMLLASSPEHRKCQVPVSVTFLLEKE